MIQKQLGLFAIIILATIMISSPILPGYAAEKVETIQGPFEVNPRVSACGGSWDSVILATTTIIGWIDKDGILMKEKTVVDVTVTLFDADETIIGEGTSRTLYQGSDEDLPKRMNDQTKMFSTNGAPSEIVNSGTILHKDGHTTNHSN